MTNDRIHGYYNRMAEKIDDPLATRNKSPDFTEHDVAYLQNFLNPEHDLMDAGAGTGLLLNKISSGFKSVLAVEMYPEFSNFIHRTDNMEIVNDDIRNFRTDRDFDLLIAFGLMNFFNSKEAQKIYKTFFGFLKPGGRLIIKNQMGRQETVIVDGLSEELGEVYYSEYRSAKEETELMRQAGFTIDSVDSIYPDTFNRWPDTWFRAVTASK